MELTVNRELLMDSVIGTSTAQQSVMVGATRPSHGYYNFTQEDSISSTPHCGQNMWTNKIAYSLWKP
jgi:hypothetical protein